MNGQCSFWTDICAGISQCSILLPAMFLTYFNDFSNNPRSKRKLFAGFTTFFSVVHDINISAGDLNEA